MRPSSNRRSRRGERSTADRPNDDVAAAISGASAGGVGPTGQLPSVDGYADLEVVGHGASATVYRARQVGYDRSVALKVLNIDVSDRRGQKRFDRERSLNGRLSDHPHVVTVLDSGFVNGRHPYLAMELFEQGSLNDQLKRNGPFDLAAALHIGVRIAGALESAHRIGVIHRDVKPQNILTSRFGEPALADFGIATILQMDESFTTALTPVHAAPELLEGADPSPLSDVYALASTIYTLLAGSAPFAGPAGEGVLAQLLRITTSDIPAIPRDDIDDALLDLLRRAMAKRPAERTPSAARFGVELQDAQRRLGHAVTSLPVSIEPNDVRPDPNDVRSDPNDLRSGPNDVTAESRSRSVTSAPIAPPSGRGVVIPPAPLTSDSSPPIPFAPDSSPPIPLAPDSSPPLPLVADPPAAIPLAPDSSAPIPLSSDSSASIPFAPDSSAPIPLVVDPPAAVPPTAIPPASIPPSADSFAPDPLAADLSAFAPPAAGASARDRPGPARPAPATAAPSPDLAIASPGPGPGAGARIDDAPEELTADVGSEQHTVIGRRAFPDMPVAPLPRSPWPRRAAGVGVLVAAAALTFVVVSLIRGNDSTSSGGAPSDDPGPASSSAVSVPASADSIDDVDPFAPSELEASAVEGVVLVRWTDNTDGTRPHLVYVFEPGQPDAAPMVVVAGDTSVKLDGLDPDAPACIIVAAAITLGDETTATVTADSPALCVNGAVTNDDT